MPPERATEPPGKPSNPDQAAAASNDQRRGAFLDNDLVAGGTVIAPTETAAQDPNDSYDLHGLNNAYLDLRSFTYDDRGKYAGRRAIVHALRRPLDQLAPIVNQMLHHVEPERRSASTGV